MKYFCKIFIPITFLIILSCSAEQDPITDSDPEKTALRFSSAIPTKGTDITNDNMDRFGIFAFYTGEGNWNAATSAPDYMYNREVSRNKINASWTEWFYSPVMYWPKVGEKLSFFAYAPFAAPENGIVVSPQSKTGVPTLTYEVSSTVSEQIDLLFSEPLWNKTKTDYPDSHVKLDFKHALTKILFYGQIQTGKEPPAGQFIKIKSISVMQINGKGVFNYPVDSGQVANWDLSANKVVDYKLTTVGGELIDKTLSTTPVSLTSSDGQLHLLPQSIRAEAMLRVEYGIYDANNQETEALVSEHPFASLMTDLLMGKAVIFTIQLGIESPGKIEASVNPWEDAFVEGDFSATYLNLSRTNITETAGKEIVVYYDTDYRYPEWIVCDCIASTGTPITDILIIPENGIIKFPNDLSQGNYTFQLRAGGIFRKIYLKLS